MPAKFLMVLAMTLVLDPGIIPVSHPEMCYDALYSASRPYTLKMQRCGGALQPCDSGNCTTGSCYHQIVPCIPKA